MVRVCIGQYAGQCVWVSVRGGVRGGVWGGVCGAVCVAVCVACVWRGIAPRTMRCFAHCALHTVLCTLCVAHRALHTVLCRPHMIGTAGRRCASSACSLCGTRITHVHYSPTTVLLSDGSVTVGACLVWVPVAILRGGRRRWSCWLFGSVRFVSNIFLVTRWNDSTSSLLRFCLQHRYRFSEVR